MQLATCRQFPQGVVACHRQSQIAPVDRIDQVKQHFVFEIADLEFIDVVDEQVELFRMAYPLAGRAEIIRIQCRALQFCDQFSHREK